MSVVLDASFALSWFFADEQSDRSRAVLDRVVATGATVPSIWHLEVANALQSAVRRKRIDEAYRDATLRDLSALPIAIDLETNRFAWTDTLRLADRFALTAYDAAYLQLAVRLALPLASLDKALMAAARASRLEVIGDA